MSNERAFHIMKPFMSIRAHISKRKHLSFTFDRLGKCNGKMSYDKKGAVTVKNNQMKLYHIPLRVYLCHQGDHWHVTSQLEQ